MSYDITILLTFNPHVKCSSKNTHTHTLSMAAYITASLYRSINNPPFDGLQLIVCVYCLSKVTTGGWVTTETYDFLPQYLSYSWQLFV